MANWLWSIPPHNYKACVESQTFAVRTAGKAAVQRIEPGDGIFAYLPGPKVVAGMFRADTPYLHSEELIWPDGVYPHRIRVIPEVVLAEVQRVPLDDFKNRLQVGEKYPNFGLVIQKVVHELSDDDAAVLEALVRENAQSTGEPPSSSGDVVELEGAAVRDDDEAQSPPVASNDKSNEALIRDLHRAQQRIGLLQREVKDLEMLLALAGPNLEDYLRLAHSSEGPAFEEATRRCLVALGFIMDSDYVGQAGQIDFVAVEPFYIFGECQASGGQNVSVTIVDKLLRHRRRYLSETSTATPSDDCCVVVSEFATGQLEQDARTEDVAILRPSQLASLLKLKREYPGAVNPYNLRPILRNSGDITSHIVEFIDRMREEIEKRVGIIEVLKNDRFARLADVAGRDPGWIQARVEAELETHLPMHEVEEILRELTSPLVGCVGVAVGPRGRGYYFYIRDYDFQVASVGPRVELDASNRIG